ncbi:hypothetical protein OGAPHI_001648 [Ogataea philodendri]|uniref:CCHC-type domain-containing protein n=1 Tax=Ogataea philodendri TaxID=1378263 RepID=A0A9P8PBX9_9ASCO|nr:uncharacterized protein OGAPHI_001648 [Ogataea philodendri]KAH3669052.1 hypothetical protein OGAPHI_001648 [Ogataea philodendri]
MDNQLSQLESVNDTIRALAQKISSKEVELRGLKEEYATKIGVLDGYLNKLKNSGILQEGDNTLEDFNPLQPMKCPNCDHVLYNNTDESKYVLLPNRTKSNTITTTQSPENSTKHAQLSKSRKSKKLTCSHCLKQGHKRAQCPEILYGKSG